MDKHLPYIHAAFGIAAQSVGKRRKTGAVIVRQGRIISHGLNHAPRPFPPELEDENFVTHPWVIHAECHALLKLTQFNFSLPKNLNGWQMQPFIAQTYRVLSALPRLCKRVSNTWSMSDRTDVPTVWKS